MCKTSLRTHFHLLKLELSLCQNWVMILLYMNCQNLRANMSFCLMLMGLLLSHFCTCDGFMICLQSQMYHVTRVLPSGGDRKAAPWCPQDGPEDEYFYSMTGDWSIPITMCNFNILAQLVSEIGRWSQNVSVPQSLPVDFLHPYRGLVTHTHHCVQFQHPSSINFWDTEGSQNLGL